MAKIYKNGDSVMRVAEISAVSIPDDDPKTVRVFLRATNTFFNIKCKSIKESLDVFENLKDILLNDGEDKDDASNE